MVGAIGWEIWWSFCVMNGYLFLYRPFLAASYNKKMKENHCNNVATSLAGEICIYTVIELGEHGSAGYSLFPTALEFKTVFRPQKHL